uniref:Uncharacterized protein n=1 Tax=Faecalibaculum rodentium TaxID=1702221 RepID=A0A140DVW9_9FIRM|nr:hypothetical protein AALO17_16620 [Faecalibaculum rodentium]
MIDSFPVSLLPMLASPPADQPCSRQVWSAAGCGWSNAFRFFSVCE